jgi:hypothetical protein
LESNCVRSYNFQQVRGRAALTGKQAGGVIRFGKEKGQGKKDDKDAEV